VRITEFPANDLNSGTGLLGTIVVKCRDLLLGYRAGYDTAVNKVTKNDIGLVYGCSDVDLHFRCTCIPHEYGLSVWCKGKRGIRNTIFMLTRPCEINVLCVLRKTLSLPMKNNIFSRKKYAKQFRSILIMLSFTNCLLFYVQSSILVEQNR